MIIFYSYGATFKLLIPFKPFKVTTAGGVVTTAGGMDMMPHHSTAAQEVTTESIDDNAADALNEMGDMVDMDHSGRLMKYKI